MSGAIKDILKQTVSLGAVMSLLIFILGLVGCGAEGIWQCKDALDKINGTLADHTDKIQTNTKNIDVIQNQLWLIQTTQHDQAYILTDIQLKVDRADKNAGN